jgi:hypothetical protein
MTAALPSLGFRLRYCRGVLVDSNVLLDIATSDPTWADWSTHALAECADHTALIINPVVYAEVSIGFSTIEALDRALPPASYEREALPWEAGFLAGKAFLGYRRRGGQRATPLPEFYMGTHAAIERLALLRRDVTRYRTYFPKLEILGPA